MAPPPPVPTAQAPLGSPPGAIVAPPGAAPTYLPPPPAVAGAPPRAAGSADIRNYPPGPLPPAWRYPTDPGTRPAPPASINAAPQRSVVQLQAPQVDPAPSNMPRVKEEEARSAPPSPPPPVAAPSPEPPKGIPQFAMARDQVASGQRPFDEGFSWLKQENYRTILHLRAPGEDDTADKDAAAQRGLQFRTLEVSAETLTPAVLDEFAKIVNDRDALPLFVYDRDGVAAGALWYLYFRSVDKLSDTEARTKASRLGFRNDEDSKKMMIAVQKFLNDQLK